MIAADVSAEPPACIEIDFTWATGCSSWQWLHMRSRCSRIAVQSLEEKFITASLWTAGTTLLWQYVLQIPSNILVGKWLPMYSASAQRPEEARVLSPHRFGNITLCDKWFGSLCFRGRKLFCSWCICNPNIFQWIYHWNSALFLH